jgi:hypothetical protein
MDGELGRRDKAAGEKRKKLAVLFAEQQLSNRKIAKALNVDHQTINNDLAGGISPRGAKNLSQTNDAKPVNGANSPPALLEGERAARLITNKAETYDARKAKRDERERELGDRILALPDEKYGVIYADPEWKFEFWSEDGAA